jgi:hypothetical protein
MKRCGVADPPIRRLPIGVAPTGVRGRADAALNDSLQG